MPSLVASPDGVCLGSCSHVLILDSEPDVLLCMQKMIPSQHKTTTSTDPGTLMAALPRPPVPDLVLLDWAICDDPSGQKALALLGEAKRALPSLPVVILSCSSDLEDAITASKRGAANVLLKPLGHRDIEFVLARFLRKETSGAPTADETPLTQNDTFVRASKKMHDLEAQCRLVAKTDIPVLITGESGTGKEIAALFIHKMSSRSERTFLKVNCAAMPLDLLESELFGYESGAFTGAVKPKPGKFEICNHGTIFLDEIGEMPGALQAKLLHVLQDGSFSRLGARSSISVDVRVIAATNINIKTAMSQRLFREDLYYRLNGFGITIPPLRDRRDEIPVLAEFFMRKNAIRYSRQPLAISRRLMQAMTNYSWPGNLRELDNTIKRYLVLEDEEIIMGALSPCAIAESTAYTDIASGAGGLKRLVRGVKGSAEAAVIAQVLDHHKWNRKAAAGELQISYKALLYKIRQYNLSETRIA